MARGVVSLALLKGEKKEKNMVVEFSFSLYICPCLLSFFLSLSLYLVSKFKSKTNNLSICA